MATDQITTEEQAAEAMRDYLDGLTLTEGTGFEKVMPDEAVRKAWARQAGVIQLIIKANPPVVLGKVILPALLIRTLISESDALAVAMDEAMNR